MARMRLTVAALSVAAAMIVIFAVSAIAGTWTWSSSPIQMVSSESFSFSPYRGGVDSCHVTFSGTVTTSPFSVVGPVANIGSITSATAGSCTGPVPTFLVSRERPWPITYTGFDSVIKPVLPETANSLLFAIPEARFLISNFGESGTASCLYTGEIGFRLRRSTTLRAPPWTFPPGAPQLQPERESFSSITLSGECPRASVSGQANAELWGPELTIAGQILEPGLGEFGTVEAGGIARIPLKLSSASEVTVRSISVRSGRHFAITDPNGCVGSRILGATKCSFNVLYEAPAERGRVSEDTVVVETTGGNVEAVVRGTT